LLEQRRKECENVSSSLDVTSTDDSLHSTHVSYDDDDDDNDDGTCSEMTDVSQVILFVIF